MIYRNRYLFRKFKTFNILGEGSLGITGFALNKDAITKEEIPGSVAASGSAIVTTLAAGIPIHLLPIEGSAYETYRYDPVDATHVTIGIGQGPYTYSDMTGVQLLNTIIVH